MGLGAGAGLRLGAAVLPVPLVGAFTGGVLGAVVGSEIGRRTGRALINAATAFVETARADLLPPTGGPVEGPGPTGA
jgi:hypothetical protein